jgi:hypothetical protein
MHEYQAHDWERAVSIPLVRVFALQCVAGIRHGLKPKAPSYGERDHIDKLIGAAQTAGSSMKITKRKKKS